MSAEIRLNAFVVNRPVHQSPGLWRHPRDRSTEYKSLAYWTGLARLLEDSLFDAIFIADGIGPNDSYGGNLDASLRHGSLIPTNDPAPLVSAMAAATRHLCFALTGNLSMEAPWLLARKLSTLDHLTDGRLGWNIVTGKSAAGMRALGREIRGHDQRYDVADEFLEIVYRLWEQSWEDGSVLWDREAGIFARPEKVHTIRHRGPYFELDAVHLVEPSPQRTPVLFQAGSSDRGRSFAARHAEGVFLAAPGKASAKRIIEDTRRRVEEAGRDPAALKFYPLMTIIVDETEAAARAKLADYARYKSYEGALVAFSGWSGVDVSQLAPEDELDFTLRDTGVTSTLEVFSRSGADRRWRLKDIAEHVGIGGQGPVVVGSAAQVADELEDWCATTGADGFNLAYVVAPETYADVGRWLVPELQRRGRFKTAYAEGTYREKLGGPARLDLPHPAAGHRHPGP
ncbi:LLM class flavin-dependent oxidoreductase [Sinirhodobacter populi]|uniref:LLM class flavin-dependent oxidoreductase n=1 Tax=Paenirhodobacter populi TaxID=2306993 RepID=A0A443K4S8_9RHOB|nr:LLM class flavin-dependent oxidoreductase [Sinirhodobacter populi]RWR27703.1 LLM class flavin-dependent oxidoreductase [Sinirhodobacter populi]